MKYVHRVPPWLSEKLKHPLVVAGAIRLGVVLGQEVSKLRTGDLTYEQFRKKLGEQAGSITGTASGVALGAWAGSVVPGVGTVLGAFGGGLAGQIFGEFVTVKSADQLRRTEGAAATEPVTSKPDDDAAADGAAQGDVEPGLVDSGSNPLGKSAV